MLLTSVVNSGVGGSISELAVHVVFMKMKFIFNMVTVTD